MGTHVWYDCRIAVFGEGVRTVMHDTVVIVWDTEISYDTRIVFVEIALRSIDDVIPRYFHMFITIGSTLHVEKSQSFKETYELV